MHPQSMQISIMLHLPHVAAIDGQVEVSSSTTQGELTENKKTAARTAKKKGGGGSSSMPSDLEGWLLSILAR